MGDYCVYVHCFPNGKRYVGITKQEPYRRWSNGNAYKGLMRRAIEKYGWENIEHIIVANGLDKDDACSTEIRLIKEYDTTNKKNGYNLSTGGEFGFSGVIRNKQWCEKIADSKKKKIIQYSTDGEILNAFESILDAAESIGGSFRVISANCNRKKRTAYGYVWRFDGDSFDLPQIKKGGHHAIAKRTFAYRNGEKIAEFESAYQASVMTGISKQSIVACCNKKAKSAGGYEWQYAAESEETVNGEE